MRKSYLAIVLAGLTMAGTAQLVQAQANPATPPAQTPQQATNLDDATLLKFSVAMEGVQAVGSKYETEFQNAADAEAAQKIQQAAQQEMVAAVEASGLTTEEYNQIAQLAQQDEQLRSRILAMTNPQ